MADLIVRTAEPREYDAIGQLCVTAYDAAGVASPDSEYGLFLADTVGRANSTNTDVLVAFDDDVLVGTVTMCGFGSPLTEVCVAGDVEPRALAVRIDRQREGIAEALIAVSAQWASDNGFQVLTVCVAEVNQSAHRLYRRLGFTRVQSRDWIASDGTLLQTYTLAVPPTESADQFCSRCGDALTEGDHANCLAALELEPPRYCPQCRRRMTVQIVPTGFRATCSRHGDITA